MPEELEESKSKLKSRTVIAGAVTTLLALGSIIAMMFGGGAAETIDNLAGEQSNIVEALVALVTAISGLAAIYYRIVAKTKLNTK